MRINVFLNIKSLQTFQNNKDKHHEQAPNLYHGGIVPRADEIARVAPDELAEGQLVAFLHSFPQLGRQVLRARALEAVGALAVDGIHLHIVWSGQEEANEGMTKIHQTVQTVVNLHHGWCPR